MFDTNLVLNDLNVDRTYALKSIVDGKSIRGALGATLGEPWTLTISHGKRNPKDPTSPDRHLMRLDRVKHDPAGVPQTASCYIVVENPIDGTFSELDLHRLVFAIYNGLASDPRFAQFINNEP
jgi:hypothetical protein